MDVAVVRLDGQGQVFAGEELVFGDEAMEILPTIGQDRMAPLRPTLPRRF